MNSVFEGISCERLMICTREDSCAYSYAQTNGYLLQVISESATMEGRIFIQFISLLITTKLMQVMAGAGWFKDYDLQEMLNEMRTVRTVSIQGSHKKYTTELTPYQKKIFELYHLIV